MYKFVFFFAFFTLHGKQIIFVFLFFGRIYGSPICFLILSYLYCCYIRMYFLTSIDLCLNDLLLFSAFWSLFSIWDFNSFLYWKSRANNSFIAESTANLRASSCFLHCKNCSVRRLKIIKIICPIYWRNTEYY